MKFTLFWIAKSITKIFEFIKNLKIYINITFVFLILNMKNKCYGFKNRFSSEHIITL